MSSKPTIAFFGATGGCANVCLVHTLRAGFTAVALARTPQKLTESLISQGFTKEELDSTLTITQGNAYDVTAVKKTLLAKNTNSLPAVIVSGLGAAPKFQLGFQFVTIDQPTICGDAAEILTQALREIYQERPNLAKEKPHITVVSTTGITRGPEDVPWSMRFLYHWILHVPHLDKKRQEDIYRNDMDEIDESKKLFSGLTVIRPTLLMGTANAEDAIGTDKLRVGTESKPELGFTIKRADVGRWMFQNVIESQEKRRRWAGEMVSLTS